MGVYMNFHIEWLHYVNPTHKTTHAPPHPSQIIIDNLKIYLCKSCCCRCRVCVWHLIGPYTDLSVLNSNLYSTHNHLNCCNPSNISNHLYKIMMLNDDRLQSLHLYSAVWELWDGMPRVHCLDQIIVEPGNAWWPCAEHCIYFTASWRKYMYRRI